MYTVYCILCIRCGCCDGYTNVPKYPSIILRRLPFSQTCQFPFPTHVLAVHSVHSVRPSCNLVQTQRSGVGGKREYCGMYFVLFRVLCITRPQVRSVCVCQSTTYGRRDTHESDLEPGNPTHGMRDKWIPPSGFLPLHPFPSDLTGGNPMFVVLWVGWRRGCVESELVLIGFFACGMGMK